jgi:plastocyanin
MMLVVQKGTTVTWTNYDPVAHSVESGTHDNPTGLFESSLLNQGQSFSYTFNEAGTFVYHCDPHPYMTGVVIVQG